RRIFALGEGDPRPVGADVEGDDALGAMRELLRRARPGRVANPDVLYSPVLRGQVGDARAEHVEAEAVLVQHLAPLLALRARLQHDGVFRARRERGGGAEDQARSGPGRLAW